MQRGSFGLATATLAGRDTQKGEVPPGAETAEIEGWEAFSARSASERTGNDEQT